MLLKNPLNRLFLFESIKNHTWFKNFEWDKLSNMSMISPYVPNLSNQPNPSKTIPYMDHINVQF